MVIIYCNHYVTMITFYSPTTYVSVILVTMVTVDLSAVYLDVIVVLPW